MKQNTFHDGEWDDLRDTFLKPKWKKVHPKDVRGMREEGLSESEARRENRELRKRMARRLRRIEKREFDREERDF